MDNKLFGIDVSRSIDDVQDEPVTDETSKKKHRGKVHSVALDNERDVSEDTFESEITEEPSRDSDKRISSREVDIIDVEQPSAQHSDRTR